jgi:surface antigen
MKKILLFFVVGIILLANDIEPNLNNEGYKSPLNPLAAAGYGGQCTAFVWGRVYEKFHIELGIEAPRRVPNANKWWTDNLYPKTLKRGHIPKNNSIVIWGGDFHLNSQGKYKNPYGHVAFIEKIEDGQIYFNEANVDTFNGTKWGGGYDGHVKIWSLEKFKQYRDYAGDILGYIYIESSQETSTNESGIFDGAGSLVSPTENIAGGNYDIALMHPHSPNNSTVVFQWLYDEDYCSQIDLFSYPTNLDVVVKAKGWNEHLIQKAFKVTLNAYGSGGGITLKRPDIENDWTTLAVTSQKPIDKKIKIIAICKKSSEPFNQGNRVNIEKPNLVDVTHDYYWTGTGSIISILENRNFDSAGVGLDYAVTLKDSKHKSFTSFQWYASDSCSQLKIKGYNENKSSVNEVKIKLWDAKDWSDTMCGTSLPCVISAPKLDRYYIIKVKSEPDAIKSGYLKAECIQ